MALHKALREPLHEALLKLYTKLCLKLTPYYEARRRDRICEANPYQLVSIPCTVSVFKVVARVNNT